MNTDDQITVELIKIDGIEVSGEYSYLKDV